MVYLSAVQNVRITREHQNDQVFTQGLPMFLGGEYNESSEFLSVNESNVESLPNLKDMCRKEVLPIGCSNWQ